MTELLLVEDDELAFSVIDGSIGRAIDGLHTRFRYHREHWNTPESFTVLPDEHVLIVWASAGKATRVLVADTKLSWATFKVRYEADKWRSIDSSTYRFVVVNDDVLKQITMTLRTPAQSHWVGQARGEKEAFQELSTSWIEKLRHSALRQVIRSSPADVERASDEHIYAVFEWNEKGNTKVVAACVERPLVWKSFVNWRHDEKLVSPIANLYTYDTVPTRFFVVSNRVHTRIQQALRTPKPPRRR